jgi:hypothetical protein
MPRSNVFTPHWPLGNLMVLALAASCGQGGELSQSAGGGAAAGGQGGQGGGGGVSQGSGGGVQGAGGGSQGVGGGATDFCAPCVDSSDCAHGEVCMGVPGHCATVCAGPQDCAAGVACQRVSLGKAPLVEACVPAAPACDVTKQPALSCTDGWSTWTHAFFTQHCAGCHQTDFELESDVRAGGESIRLAVERGAMPPGLADVVSQDDRHRLAMWLACGSMSPPTGIH